MTRARECRAQRMRLPIDRMPARRAHALRSRRSLDARAWTTSLETGKMRASSGATRGASLRALRSREAETSRGARLINRRRVRNQRVSNVGSRAALADSKTHGNRPSNSVIVGGGPTGLACAIALARRGWDNIEVWERLSKPPASASEVWGDASRSYNVGLSGRGQSVLKDLDLLEPVLDKCAVVKGRMDWGPDGVPKERLANKAYDTQVIQRDRLVSVLVEEIEKKYADKVNISYNVACVGCDFGENGVTLERGECGDDCDINMTSGTGRASTTVPVVFGAEGNSMHSAVVREMDHDKSCDAKVVRFPNTNPRVYKTIPIYLPSGMRKDLNYSARTKAGVALECLPTKEGVLVGIMLVKPEDEETCVKLSNKESLKQFFDEQFPMFVDWIRDADIATMADSKFFGLPSFGYVDKSLNMGGQAVLLGDTIHTVKPYFGLGVNSAWEDVRVLIDTLDEADGDTSVALPNYTKKRKDDAKALVELSRSFDGGFMTFVLPLIVDSIFNKIAPWLFMPNTIQMLQREEWSFSAIAKRKWLDRFMQGAVIASFFSAVGCALLKLSKQFIFPFIARALTRGGTV